MSKVSTAIKMALGGSCPVAYLLGLIFITLKLVGTITWSWWWVTAPFWAPWALVLAGLGVYLLAVLFLLGITAVLVKLGK